MTRAVAGRRAEMTRSAPIGSAETPVEIGAVVMSEPTSGAPIVWSIAVLAGIAVVGTPVPPVIASTAASRAASSAASTAASTNTSCAASPIAPPGRPCAAAAPERVAKPSAALAAPMLKMFFIETIVITFASGP